MEVHIGAQFEIIRQQLEKVKLPKDYNLGDKPLFSGKFAYLDRTVLS